MGKATKKEQKVKEKKKVTKDKKKSNKKEIQTLINDKLQKSPYSEYEEDSHSFSHKAKKTKKYEEPRNVKSPIDLRSTIKSPEWLNQKNIKNDRVSMTEYKKSTKHNYPSKKNEGNKLNSDSVQLVSRVTSSENFLVSSPIQNFIEEMKPETVGSFSVMSPIKLEKDKTMCEPIFGSLGRNSPLKIVAIRQKDRDKKKLECLVKWKLNGKETLNDSIVDANDIRQKFPYLLLDFYEERLKFK